MNKIIAVACRNEYREIKVKIKITQGLITLHNYSGGTRLDIKTSEFDMKDRMEQKEIIVIALKEVDWFVENVNNIKNNCKTFIPSSNLGVASIEKNL